MKNCPPVKRSPSPPPYGAISHPFSPHCAHHLVLYPPPSPPPPCQPSGVAIPHPFSLIKRCFVYPAHLCRCFGYTYTELVLQVPLLFHHSQVLYSPCMSLGAASYSFPSSFRRLKVLYSPCTSLSVAVYPIAPPPSLSSNLRCYILHAHLLVLQFTPLPPPFHYPKVLYSPCPPFGATVYPFSSSFSCTL